ncbi:MAG: LysM domain-containing protein, partial [Parabacteroides sp.]|nr:LysM domain-containing protein [Parabacteroides sp.]
MRKSNFIMVMFILLCSVKSWGQDIVNLHHIVQRGETIEILADKYRLTMAQVRKSVDSPPGMLTEDHHHTVHE